MNINNAIDLLRKSYEKLYSPSELEYKYFSKQDVLPSDRDEIAELIQSLQADVSNMYEQNGELNHIIQLIQDRNNELSKQLGQLEYQKAELQAENAELKAENERLLKMVEINKGCRTCAKFIYFDDINEFVCKHGQSLCVNNSEWEMA